MNLTSDLEAQEQTILADYATKSFQSLGRKISEDKHPYRTEFQRDRDRIIYCAAFRRLEEKTQVFYDLNTNYFRTRLTHTLEVAQTARVVCVALGLNADLAEAIACAHDIGHPPFGHQGEELLNKLVCETDDCSDPACVGFEHNLQSLRIVDFIEDKYPAFAGLNLTYEVLRGIAKHKEHFPGECTKYDNVFAVPKSLEAIVVDKSDRISYLAHDLEDALFAGYIGMKLVKKQPLMQLVMQTTGVEYCKLSQDKCIYMLVRDFKNFVVSAFIKECAKRLASWDNSKDVHEFIEYPDEIGALLEEFYSFLYTYFYEEQAFKQIVRESAKVLKEVFNYYMKNPQMLPPDKHNLSKTRRVCDFIALHTDRTILAKHKSLMS